MKEREVVIVDSEDGCRGGSIYLKRYRRWLQKQNIKCSYRHIKRDLGGVYEAMCLVVRSWIRDDIEVRGTVPADIILLMAAKRSVGYIQSPAEYWSDRSRLVLRLGCITKAFEIRCVSETTAASIGRICRFRNTRIEYAKIEGSSYGDKSVKKHDGAIVFIVIDQGSPEKGYHRHLEIVKAATKHSRTRVEI